jgi:hypothetical protein
LFFLYKYLSFYKIEIFKKKNSKKEMNILKILVLITLFMFFVDNTVLAQSKSYNTVKNERFQVTLNPETTLVSDSNRNDMETLETAKDFLFKNGYDTLENDVESTVKFSKFQSMKSFNQNKGIQNTLKL